VGKLLKPSPIFPFADAGLSLALKRGLDSHRPQRAPPRPGFENGKTPTEQAATRDDPGSYPARGNRPEQQQSQPDAGEQYAHEESETFALGVNVVLQAAPSVLKLNLQRHHV